MTMQQSSYEKLEQRRERLIDEAQALRARGEDAVHVDQLIDHIEGVLGQTNPTRRSSPPFCGSTKVITQRVRIDDRHELHVLRRKGRVDARIWYVPHGQTELVASRQGFTITADQARELHAALTQILDEETPR